MEQSSKPPSNLIALPSTGNASPELLKKVWLAIWIDKTQRRFEQELSEVRTEDTLEDWERIYDRIGQYAFERTLREGFLTWKFFPKPSEILELREQLIETVVRERMAERMAQQEPWERLDGEEAKELWGKVKEIAKGKKL